MIAPVARAITQHYNKSTTLKDALAGGLFFQQAPQDVSFPYAVFYFIGASHEEIMDATFKNSIIDVDLQFNIFTDSQDGGASIASVSEILDNAYHWAEIHVDGYSRIKMQRQAIMPVLYVDEIWQVSITYELSFQS
ncbi:hypothetical protein LCGC14_0553500 [marine sediment metagenome]|uniref:Uncharacterized protein n=1 Tax=marine sediment metagenome TaxID=412755 RepID=A0A0F9RP38_9ZZZZ